MKEPPITFQQYKDFIYHKTKQGYVNIESNTLMNLDDVKNKYRTLSIMYEIL